MPFEYLSADDPRAWLQRAKSDLNIAKRHSDDIYLEDLCFHAQQAAEKAIKAVLIQKQINFKYTHDLSLLVGLLQSIVELPEFIKDASTLTSYAVASRYPGADELVDYDEWIEAIDLAQAIYSWALEIVGNK